jgi:hypothetical protein
MFPLIDRRSTPLHYFPLACLMSNDDNVDELYNWAVRHGCRFQSAIVAPHPLYGGYGIFNSRNSAANEDEELRLAVFIPNTLIVSIDLISEQADESDELAEALNALPELPTLEPIIAVFLLYHLYLSRKGREGRWSTYLKFLPKSTMLPVSWNESEKALLHNCHTSISVAVPAKVASLRGIYSELQNSSKWFQSISWDEYVLADCWVSSRSILDPNTDTPILVPILDMANHSPSRNAAWEVSENGMELRREPVEITDKEELTISYDLDRGTGERLYRYGFIEDMTPGACSKAISLFGRNIPSPVPSGNIFRISLGSIQDGFHGLSFLTYENWLRLS